VAAHDGGDAAAGAAEEAPAAAAGADQAALDGGAALQAPVLSADPEAVRRVAKQWDDMVQDFRKLTTQARHLAGERPLQHGKADDTWTKFSGKWKPNADMLPDSLDQLATSLQSIPDNLRLMAKDDVATEEQNTDRAQQLGRALEE
jgi:hypothetical protein